MVNAGIKPTLMRYAESQTRKIAEMVISQALSQTGDPDIDIRQIVITDTNPNGTTTRTFNSEKIKQILADTTHSVQKNLREAEKGNLHLLELDPEIEWPEKKPGSPEGILYSVPLGQATNNALLGNLGPKIPVSFKPIGDVKSTVNTKVEPYGINNVFVEVSIHLRVNVQIIIPFATKVTTIEQDIPVVMGYFEGQVPQFYNHGGSAGPSIQVPVTP